MSEKLLDGVELAILFNRFEGIVRKMSNTLYRTGRSGVLNRARDFSCCITPRAFTFSNASVQDTRPSVLASFTRLRRAVTRRLMVAAWSRRAVMCAL